MMKLYRNNGERIEYWEAWDADREVVIHWGVIGQHGETRIVRTSLFRRPERIMEREARALRNEGFCELAIEDHAQLIVQMSSNGWDVDTCFAMIEKVEFILNQHLGWTGNGHCDGHDIGSGTLNFFSFVVVPDQAAETVIEALSAEHQLSGAIIAIQRGDNVKVVWPRDYSKPFSFF